MADSSSESLKGDMSRQAVPSLRGYAYQIWQSVYRWVTLGKDDILYLEGAEDLDVLSPEKAETIQVKDTKKSITLRSRDVLEAIKHFWELQERNPNVTIFFRFLTTAERVREQGSPFGNIGGLDYWDSCKRQGVDLRPLRMLLQSQESLPETLHEFITSSDDATLRSRLITRLDWDTGSKPKEYIESLVNKEVAYYGQQYHQLLPSESVKVVSHLLKHVWDTVCRENNRRLEYFDFMELFENVTTERVDRQELRRLRQLNTSVSTGILEALLASGTLGVGPFPSIQGMDLQTSAPPLPDRVARRESLVASLSQQVKTSGLLVFKGSTGMGKSTLAALITYVETQEWIWLRMRGLEPEQIRELLYQTALVRHAQSSEMKVVLDDLNFGSHAIKYEDALMGLLYIILSRGGQAIITTQGDLPNRITSHFPMSAVSSIEVPPLALTEVKQMVKDYGCPSEDKQNALTVFIWARTRGHPQLVHATVRKLAAMDWPMPGSGNIGEAEDIEAVRREARSILQEQMPSEAAKILAYRLSILGQPFRRDHALQLGIHPPAFTLPGETFDQLVGPWIERLNDTYYAVSPLLEDAAKAVWASQDITSLHQAAAEAFLSCRPRTLLEASGVLRHGLSCGVVTPVFFTLFALEKLPEDAWPEVVQQFLWIVTVALLPEEKIFPTHPFISALLRRFQFLIAVEVDSSTLAPLVSAAWERETAAIDLPEFGLPMRLMFLVSTVIYAQVPLDQRTIVLRIVEARRLVKEQASLFDSNHSGVPDDLPAISATTQLILFAVARCTSTDDLEEFLSALDEQPAEIRADLLLSFREDNYWANLLCGKVWFNEAQTASPNWTRCIELFERAVRLGGSWGVESLVAAACHALAVIHDEYLDDPQTALSALAKGTAQLGPGYPVLENARAMILYRKGQYKEALHIWETVLSHWQSVCDVTPAISYRKAEICAIEENDWGKAAALSLRGEEAASRAEFTVMAVGFRADYAYAFWRCHDHNTADAITAFVMVLDALSKLPDPQNDLQCYALYVRVDYALSWILQDLRGKQTHAEPHPACFSDSEVNESYKTFPIRPVVLLWNTLANIEFETKSGNAVFKRLEEENKNPSMPNISLLIEHLRIRHALRNNEMEILVSCLSEYFRGYDVFRREIMEGKFKLKEGELHPDLLIVPDNSMKITLLINILFAALIILVSRRLRRNIPLEKWKIDANLFGFYDSNLEDWFSFIAESSQKSLAELIAVMRNVGEGEKRYLASLFITAAEAVKPIDRFYADILLVTSVQCHIWRQEIEDEIAGLVTKGWSKVASEQSFALQMPKIYSPAILAACQEPARGLKKAAKTLLTAKNAVQLSVPEQVLTQLRKELL